MSNLDIVPNEEAGTWAAGESIVFKEGALPAALTDDKGNWPSNSFFCRIVYTPMEKMIYQSEISLETSAGEVTASFSLENHSDTLTNAITNENIVTITLTEGTLRLWDIQLLLSADGDTFEELYDYQILSGDEPDDEWNNGEALVINESVLPSTLSDAAGNWRGTDCYVRIYYYPTEEVIFTDHVTLEESTSDTEGTPPLIFELKNHSDTLTNAGQDDGVATVLLTEGTVRLDRVRLTVSSDGDIHYPLGGITPVPNNDPMNEWNVAETVVINEADLPANLTDENGNWPSTTVYVKIDYLPTQTTVYSNSVMVEESASGSGEQPSIVVTCTNEGSGSDHNYSLEVAMAAGPSIAMNDLTIQIQDATGTPVAAASFDDAHREDEVYYYIYTSVESVTDGAITTYDNNYNAELDIGDRVIVDPNGTAWGPGDIVVFKLNGSTFYECDLV